MSGKQAKRERRFQRLRDVENEINPPHPLEQDAAGGRQSHSPISAAVPEREPVEPLQGEAIASPMNGPMLLTLAEVAEMLNISIRTAHRLKKDFPGRCVLGGSVRYHRGLIERWILGKIEGQSNGE